MMPIATNADTATPLDDAASQADFSILTEPTANGRPRVLLDRAASSEKLASRGTERVPLPDSADALVFAPWEDWVPGEYLRDYYSVVEPDEIATIRFIVDATRGIEGVSPILIFGCGPTLHHVFPVAPYASELHLTDYLSANLEEIGAWIDRRDTGHDWSDFVRYTLRCEGLDEPTVGDIDEREQLVREKVSRLIRADAGVDDPLGPAYRAYYPVVVSCYCADSATPDKAVWRRYMRNITSLLAPNGLFVTAALNRATYYLVGTRRFPSADIDEAELRRCLETDLGLEHVAVETRRLPSHEALGYGGVILAHARMPERARRRTGSRFGARARTRSIAAVSERPSTDGRPTGEPRAAAPRPSVT